MKPAVRSPLAALAAAAAIVALASCSGDHIQSRIETAAAMADPVERIAAVLEIALEDPGLASEHYELATSTIANAAHEMGEADAVVAVCDSLLVMDLPTELRLRLMGELHMGLVIQGYYAEQGKEGFLARSDRVARDLLEAKGSPAEVLMQVAGFHMYALDFTDPVEIVATRQHWLPYELAARGFACKDGPVERSDTAVLSGSLGAVLSHVSEAFGAGRAIAVTDSLLAADPCPTARAVILANRYDVAAASDPSLALGAASDLVEIGRRPGLWPLLRAVSLDILDRELDPALALDLAETAIDFVESRSDSGSVLFAVGRSHHALGNHEEAALALRRSAFAEDGMPELTDPRVDALLTVYDEWGRNDLAIDVVSSILARSLEEDEPSLARLAALLESEGRSADEMPDLIRGHRYAGVRDAPDFTLVDLNGGEFALSEHRGQVVMVCFWGFG